MSEHTPLTEAEAIVRVLAAHHWGGYVGTSTDAYPLGRYARCSGCDWISDYDPDDLFAAHNAHVAERILAARTSTATADTGHKAGCQEFPTGWLCVSDCTTVWHDKAADTGLRERVEALADEWEGWAKNRSTARIDAFRDAAEYLRDALATPASTEDRADNEGVD